MSQMRERPGMSSAQQGDINSSSLESGLVLNTKCAIRGRRAGSPLKLCSGSAPQFSAAVLLLPDSLALLKPRVGSKLFALLFLKEKKTVPSSRHKLSDWVICCVHRAWGCHCPHHQAPKDPAMGLPIPEMVLP